LTAKIGTIDIETAPLEGHVWGLFDQNVGLNQIKTEWSILSYCFKPLGGSKRSLVYEDNSTASDPRDDRKLLDGLWSILHEYDFLVAQNGKRFDMRKIRARMVLAGMRPPSPVKVLDTMLMARQVGAFTSNKLEWLSQYLSTVPKSKHKEFPGFELWAECLKGNPRAWASMRKYNIPDVLSTEEVYLKLRPWVEGHPNVAVYDTNEGMQCPRCGSNQLNPDGFSYTNVGKYNRYHCVACDGWSRDRYTVNSKIKRKGLLAA
jgi:hypothetical protein